MRHNPIASEPIDKKLFMGHEISCFYVPVVRSFFILLKTLGVIRTTSYDQLAVSHNITFFVLYLKLFFRFLYFVIIIITFFL